MFTGSRAAAVDTGRMSTAQPTIVERARQIDATTPISLKLSVFVGVVIWVALTTWAVGITISNMNQRMALLERDQIVVSDSLRSMREDMLRMDKKLDDLTHELLQQRRIP